jgi:uncharacterized membrane protein YebE (DUF533 family)
MKTKLFITAISFFGLLSNVAAQQYLNKVNRTNNQRIVQGVKSGELTRAETARLAKNQREITRDISVAKADGIVTKTERREIKREQCQQSRNIKRAKHNNRDRS